MTPLFWILRMLENTDFYYLFLKKVFGYNLQKLNEKQTRKLVSWYLKQNYNYETKHPFAIFRILDSALNKLPLEELENMAIESPYLDSMPEAVIKKYLMNHCDKLMLTRSEIFRLYLTTCITSDEDLIELLNKKALIDEDYVFRLFASTFNGYGIIQAIGKFRYYRSQECLENMVGDIGDFSLNELQLIYKNVKTLDSVVVDNLAKVYLRSKTDEEKDKVIDAVIKMAMDTKDDCDKIASYTRSIANSTRFNEEMKTKLVMKLLEQKNYDFIYNWFLAGVECDYNYSLIDALLEEDENVLARLLVSVSDNYLDYVVTHIIDKGRDKTTLVLEEFLELENLDIKRCDDILSIIYHVWYDYKIAKDVALKLILNGTCFTTKYFREFDFNENERNTILDYYSYTDGIDELYLDLYERYLETGNKDFLINQNEAKEKIKRMRLARNNVKPQ